MTEIDAINPDILDVRWSEAKEYGLDRATILAIIRRAFLPRVYQDGKRWVRVSLPDWGGLMPWCSTRTTRRNLDTLRSEGVILAKMMDEKERTLWYSICEDEK